MRTEAEAFDDGASIENEETIRADVQEWFYRQPDYYSEQTTLDELLRYVLAVHVQRNDPKVAGMLTPRCTECGQHVDQMDPYVRSLHIIVDGYVIVGCEWYWVVDPNAVGITDGWCDWAEGMTPAAKAYWVETGRITDGR